MTSSSSQRPPDRGARGHLRPNPKTEISADALLPGDPARALRLAQALLDQPLMSNHARGLWGYTGQVSDDPDRTLTIQSTGIGAASGAVVLAELAGLGVRRAIRVGTCCALPARPEVREAELGEVLVVEEAVALDGVSAGLCDKGVGSLLPADPSLTNALVSTADARPARVLGQDPLAEKIDAVESDHLGAIATDLQAAALIAVGNRVGVSVGCICLVAESADGESSLTDEEVMEATVEIGQGAASALGANRAGLNLE